MNGTLFDYRKMLTYMDESLIQCLLCFKNNQIITASHIIIASHEMTMNKRLNMAGPNLKVNSNLKI